MTFHVSQRVKPSYHALEADRMRMVEYLYGPIRDRREEAYNKHAAKRGTVREVLEDSGRIGGPTAGLVIDWDNGTESWCLPYMVEPAG